MRPGAVIALVLAAIAGTALVVRYWYAPSSAKYEPLPALTDSDRSFLASARDILETAMFADQHASKHAWTQSVRDFAKNAADDHARLLSELTSRAHSLDPDFVFTPPAKAKPSESRGIPYDREYLNESIRRHEHAMTLMQDTSAIQDNPSLMRFVSLWRATAERHTSEAQKLLSTLPSVASNLPLILVSGMIFVGLAALLRLGKRLRTSN